MSILNKSYDLLEITRFKYFVTLWNALFIFVFLWIFEPFGAHTLSFQFKITALGLYTLFGLIISVLHIFFLQDLIFRRFTIGTTILWLTWIVILISVSNTLVHAYFISRIPPRLIDFAIFGIVTLLISLLPLSLLILIHYNFILKKKLAKTDSINSLLKLREPFETESQTITLEAENPRHNLSVYADKLLYIEAADNYIDIFYKHPEGTKHHMLRSSLRKAELSLQKFENLVRCHKSYLVNLDQVESVTGNSAGYKLNLKEDAAAVPVSRKMSSDILDKLSQLM